MKHGRIKICTNLGRQEDIFCSGRSTGYAGKNGIDGDDENLKLDQSLLSQFHIGIEGRDIKVTVSEFPL
jgi:hypothetical protein